MGGNTEHYTTQSEVCKNSILFHTNCRSENDLPMLLCCSELTMHMHLGTGQHVIFTLLRNWIGFCHGQILIETATHSLSSVCGRVCPETTPPFMDRRGPNLAGRLVLLILAVLLFL